MSVETGFLKQQGEEAASPQTFSIKPDAVKKTIKIVIQIEGDEGIEIHETSMDYEGMSHDEKTNIFSFFGKPSNFVGQSNWIIKSMKATTPQSIVDDMKKEEG